VQIRRCPIPAVAGVRRALRILSILAACETAGSAVVACGADDSLSPGDGGAFDSAASDARPDGARAEGGTSPGEAGAHVDGGSPADARGTNPVSNDGGAALASFIAPPFIDFGLVGCGTPAVTQTVAISNRGNGRLAVSATTTGSAFSISPSTLILAPGADQTLKITAQVPGNAAAGTPLTGSLDIFTNDPAAPNTTSRLSVTPSGANFVIQPMGTVFFPPVKVGKPAPSQMVTVTNVGNAAGALVVGAIAPASSGFVFANTDGGAPVPGSGVTIAPGGGTWTGVVQFTPGSTSPSSASAALSVLGVTCNETLPSSIGFNGVGSTGQITVSQTTLDFGLADCGGQAPPPQTFTLTNSGAVDALVTSCSIGGAPCSAGDAGANGFATTAAIGQVIAASSALTISVTAPPVPAVAGMAPITSTLTIGTDADMAGKATDISLKETPHGAALAYAPAPPMADFGSAVLLVPPSAAATHAFSVANSGNAPANVILSAASSAAAGLDAGADATVSDAGSTDATIVGPSDASAGPPSPFTLSQTTFSVAAGATQSDSVTFAPVIAGGNVGGLSMTTTTDTVLCQPVPAPVPLTGVGIGGGLSLSPPGPVVLKANCGGTAPSPATFAVTNSGTRNLTWALTPGQGVAFVAPDGGVSDAGAPGFVVSANPFPGLLLPGMSSTVTVTAPAIPSPAPATSPAAYTSQLTISTDVPFDAPHVIVLSEPPLGDQLSFSVPNVNFGQIPVNTATLPLTFAVINNANAGSPDAVLALQVAGDGGAAFTVTPPTSFPNVSAGSSSSAASVVFNAPANQQYAATIALTTTDPLCAALPPPLPLNGTGTAGQVAVSPTTLAFGTDPADPKGLVNCGATGEPHTITVSNIGNDLFNVTAIALGGGADGGAPPYVLTPPTLPALVPIGGPPLSIALAPNAIPQTIATDPKDPAPFAGTVTITTDAPLDMPHTVSLVMQARGAVIADTLLATTWNFGTIGFGSIGTISNTVQNTGNAPASVALTGISLPKIFALLNNPTTAAVNAVTPIVGQFIPASADGSWNDQAVLNVTADAFCAPLPAHWAMPTIGLTGSSNSNPAVTESGTLQFPTTDCGSAAPAAQSITLTNNTNVAYPYTLKFSSGAHYAIQNGGPGMLPATGTVTVLVSPKTITPGVGVVPGSAPYADSLIVTAGTTPPTTFNVPISWTLNGAALSLPYGAGPRPDPNATMSFYPWFYPADSSGTLTLPMSNSGTATATVEFAVKPASGVVSLSPSPVDVLPGIAAAPALTNVASTACPTTTTATVTFLYSGPVCQPFQVPSISVHSCAGTFSP
jgi:hypothetical protein